MAQPPSVERASAALRKAYRDAWRAVLDEQQSIIDDPTAFRRLARLREMQARIAVQMDELDDLASAWIRRELPKVYGAGGFDAAAELGLTFGFTQLHTEAIQLLANDLFTDLLAATKNVKASTKSMVRRIVRDKVLESAIVGKTAGQARDEVVNFLARHGIHSVVYKNGAKVALDSYADMAVRTKSAVGYNLGTLNQSRDSGVAFMEIFDSSDCGLSFHEDPTLANGMVVDIKTAEQFPISHPRCVRALSPRPDITSKKAAKSATPSTTPEQIADQREANARRRERQARAATQRRITARRQNPLERRTRMLTRRQQLIEKHRGPAVPDLDDALLKDRVRSLVGRAERNEPGITSLVQEAAAAAKDRLEGLKFRLKANRVDPELAPKFETALRRLSQKVRTEMTEGRKLTFQQSLDDLGDMIRYTSVFEPRDYGRGGRSVLAAMRERFDEVRISNYWNDPGYQGINTNFRDRATGQMFEFQIHTPQSLIAKQRAHPIYEEYRAIGPGARKRALENQMRAIYDPIRRGRPKGAEGIR